MKDEALIRLALAAVAMHGILAGRTPRTYTHAEDVARASFLYADHLLAEARKTAPEVPIAGNTPA